MPLTFAAGLRNCDQGNTTMMANSEQVNKVEMHGSVVPKGTQLLVGFGSANHDAEELRDPETLDAT
jgi:cytochrome P450